VPVIVAGVVFENGSEAPTAGCISIFILVFAGTYSVRKLTSACCPESIELTTVPTPFIFVVNPVSLAVELVHDRITGVIVGVEKTILSFDKSIDGVPGTRPMENRISLIPFVVSFDNP